MFKKVFLFILFSLLLNSCTSEDDICLNGDTTSRLKVKFKTKDGKLKTLDSLYIKVDYGNGAENILANKSKIDSALVPLRIDESNFTDLYFSTSKDGVYAKVKLNYTTTTEFVSPACGIKRNYENLNPVLEIPGAVTALEKNQNQILNEDKTHLFLIF